MSSNHMDNFHSLANTELALDLSLNPTPSKKPSLTLALSSDSCGGSSFSIASALKRERSREVASDESEKGVEINTSGEDDEDGGHVNNNCKKKLRLTKAQSGLLEEAFRLHTTLHPKQKQKLARDLNLRPRQVEVWFQNRRARTKLKQTEVDCEYLKKCCKTLTDENQRLRQEVEELKAQRGVAQPMYMKVPPPAATMCPSCEQIGDTTKGRFTMPPKPCFFNTFTTSSAAC